MTFRVLALSRPSARRAGLTDQESHDRTTLWRARHASPTRGAFMSVRDDDR
jgi:hypothetical protein